MLFRLNGRFMQAAYSPTDRQVSGSSVLMRCLAGPCLDARASSEVRRALSLLQVVAPRRFFLCLLPRYGGRGGPLKHSMAFACAAMRIRRPHPQAACWRRYGRRCESASSLCSSRALEERPGALCLRQGARLRAPPPNGASGALAYGRSATRGCHGGDFNLGDRMGAERNKGRLVRRLLLAAVKQKKEEASGRG